jgi:hypothetical protein
MKTSNIPQEKSGAMLPAIALAILALALNLVIPQNHSAQGEVGLIFAPWASEPEIHAAIGAAGGQFVNASRLSNVVVAYAPGVEFHQLVRAQGAWMIISANGLCEAPGIIEQRQI